MIKAHCFLHRPTLLHKMELKEVRSAPPSDYQELQFNRDQHTVVTIGHPVEHPRDYVVWSICSLFHGNPLCFGLVALIFSIKWVPGHSAVQHPGSGTPSPHTQET
ncbi:uncharacterized protein LOC130388703 isoform X2 [Gadus chalcogrammus]|uniref:uncharacterized protein LOC130388703 isoform X2 n=1 Tax=Gadus chalcogrammus TaxID=1042646 RepID=UPI0024C4AF99|nr:uncharacterized protein LOC130388703 isoform X2 [Gadus chalcogrammus]